MAVNPRVAVRSGHKCGKSMSLVGLSLWWICTRPRGKVAMTAPSADQVSVEGLRQAKASRGYVSGGQGDGGTCSSVGLCQPRIRPVGSVAHEDVPLEHE